MRINKLNFNTENVEVITDKRTFLISINDYIEHQFVIGQEVDTKLLSTLEKAYKALDVEQFLVKIISSQECCSFQLKEKLFKKFKNQKEKIDKLIEKYVSMGYIDDIEYLRNYIDHKLNKCIGIQRIIFELKNIGFDEEDIMDFISQEHYEIELIKAEEISNKIIKNTKDNKDRKLFNKLNYLGYSNEVIEKVLSKLGLLNNDLML